jgi:predicted peptidase
VRFAQHAFVLFSLVLCMFVGGCTTSKRADRVYTSGQWDHRTIDLGTQAYQYAVWIPDGWSGPGRAILFLHGLGECGTDGFKQIKVGLPPRVEASPNSWPFVVIAPQKPDGQSQWEDHAGAVFGALTEVVAEGLVDGDRIAITGLSQGGHGTIRFAAIKPEFFRAAAPVCGYTARPPQKRNGKAWTDPDSADMAEVAGALATLPVWIFHGGRDDVVPPDEARNLEAAIRARGGDVRLTIFPEANHNAWDPAYDLPELREWLIRETK